MTLNASGPISLGGATTGQSINLEIGAPATSTVSLNDTIVRTLANVVSGQIVVPTDFYGKSLSSSFFQVFTYPTTIVSAVLNTVGGTSPNLGISGSDILYTMNGASGLSNYIIKLNNSGNIQWSAQNTLSGWPVSNVFYIYSPLIQHTNGFIYGAGSGVSPGTTNGRGCVYKFNGSTGAYVSGGTFKTTLTTADPGAFNSIQQSKISNNLLVAGSTTHGTGGSNVYISKLTTAGFDENLNLLGYNRAITTISTGSSGNFIGTSPDGYAYASGTWRTPPIPGANNRACPTIKVNDSGTWVNPSPTTSSLPPTSPSAATGVNGECFSTWESDFSYMYYTQAYSSPAGSVPYFAKVDKNSTPQYGYSYPSLASTPGPSGVSIGISMLYKDISPSYVFATSSFASPRFIAINKATGDISYKFTCTSTTNTNFYIHSNLIVGDYMYLAGVINGVTNKSFLLKIKTDLSQLTGGLTATTGGINITITPQATDAKTSQSFYYSGTGYGLDPFTFVGNSQSGTINSTSNIVTETKTSI